MTMRKDDTSGREAGALVRNRRSGNAIIETAFLAPWIFFLFVGVFDMGFYCYAAICTQNAARAVVLSQVQSTVGVAPPSPCTVALNELNMLPNVSAATTCTGTPVNVPPVVTLDGSSCPDSSIGSAVTLFASSPFCMQASVTYQTIPLIPIPGLLTGQLTLTRTAEMRILE
jgi:Flp pilus assembly protein TadG